MGISKGRRIYITHLIIKRISCPRKCSCILCLAIPSSIHPTYNKPPPNLILLVFMFKVEKNITCENYKVHLLIVCKWLCLGLEFYGIELDVILF